MTKAFSGKAILNCEYCGKQYVNDDWWRLHEMDCKKNPENVEHNKGD